MATATQTGPAYTTFAKKESNHTLALPKAAHNSTADSKQQVQGRVTLRRDFNQSSQLSLTQNSALSPISIDAIRSARGRQQLAGTSGGGGITSNSSGRGFITVDKTNHARDRVSGMRADKEEWQGKALLNSSLSAGQIYNSSNQSTAAAVTDQFLPSALCGNMSPDFEPGGKGGREAEAAAATAAELSGRHSSSEHCLFSGSMSNRANVGASGRDGGRMTSCVAQVPSDNQNSLASSCNTQPVTVRASHAGAFYGNNSNNNCNKGKADNGKSVKKTRSGSCWSLACLMGERKRSTSIMVKVERRVLEEKDDLIKTQSKRLEDLENEILRLTQIIQERDYKITRMEDILSQKRVSSGHTLAGVHYEDGAPPSSHHKTVSRTSSTQTAASKQSVCSENSQQTVQGTQTTTSNTQQTGSTSVTPTVRLRHKRQGISAAPTNKKNLALAKRNSKLYLDPASLRCVEAALTKNEFLSHLEASHIKLMSQCIQGPQQVPAGTEIIKQGDSGDGLFILETGTVHVTKDGEFLRTIQASRDQDGIVFGELAILYNCSRTASILAVTDCKVWYLDRDSFQAIAIETGQSKLKEHKQFLKQVQLFKSFPERKLVKILGAFEEESFQSGEYIIKQESHGETFYIITSGTVEVTQELKGDGEVEIVFLRSMKKGDYFGEKALLEPHALRTANCIAKDSVSCLCLEREDFVRLIGNVASRRYGNEDVDGSRFSISSTGSPSCMSEDDQKRLSTASFLTDAMCDSALATPITSALDEPQFVQKKKVGIEYRKVDFGDLEYMTTLGVGGFGRVELVRVVNDLVPLALKRIRKAHVKELKQEQHVINERNILLQCRSPFVIRLFRTYRDRKYVYLLTEACLGGELWTLLRTKNHFTDNWARFYTGCAVEALSYLHARGIIYRDLKPENLVLLPSGYAKLCDFGFAKRIGKQGDKTYTFCGTPEYVPPEIILNKGHDFTADLWALGIFIYELATGTPPFNYNDSMETYRAALRGVALQGWGPDGRVSRGTRECILALAKDQPAQRLGAGKGGFNDIRRYKWFRSFDWNGLIARSIPPPYKPDLKNPFDTTMFDPFGEEDEIPEDEMSGWDIDF